MFSNISIYYILKYGKRWHCTSSQNNPDFRTNDNRPSQYVKAAYSVCWCEPASCHHFIDIHSSIGSAFGIGDSVSIEATQLLCLRRYRSLKNNAVGEAQFHRISWEIIVCSIIVRRHMQQYQNMPLHRAQTTCYGVNGAGTIFSFGRRSLLVRNDGWGANEHYHSS